MSRNLTIGFQQWNSDKRIDIPETRNNARTPIATFKIGHERIEITRRDLVNALQALHTAEVSGGQPDAWRAIIKTAEGDLVQELRAAIQCDAVAAATERYPGAHYLVIGFEQEDQAMAAKAALSTLLNFKPPASDQ